MLGRLGEGQTLLNVQKRGNECAANDRRLLGRFVAAVLPVCGSRGMQANTNSPRSTNYPCPRDRACLRRRGTDVAAIAAFGRVGELALSLPHLRPDHWCLIGASQCNARPHLPLRKTSLGFGTVGKRALSTRRCTCEERLFKIWRPTEGEDAAYNGWKQMHAMKH
eukprot:scaffold1299_cov385-Pavlova_lutheri.AAC.19